MEKKSLLCPNCRRLISSDEPVCPYCGLSRPGSWWKTKFAGAFLKQPEDAIRLLIYFNVAFYILSVLLKPSQLGMGANPLTFLAPSNDALIWLGATGAIPIRIYHQWQSLITASFLHGSILHILFNMMALRQLGPFIIHEYGFHRFVVIYIVSGIGGFLMSLLAGVPLTLGASASLTGLIGAVLYYGRSRGGYYGDAVYKQAMGWIVGLLIFGFLAPGINNWAHGGGLVSGIVLAFALDYQDRRRDALADRLLGNACLFATAAVLLYNVFRTLRVFLAG